jgi:protoporphyrinogen oxidase
MGGHRFFTKSGEVDQFWHEIMKDDFLRRPRLSRIFYNQKFFYYPLKPLNALMGLGVVQGLLIVASYIRWQLFPYPHEDTFEQWVTNRFGRRLFRIFFKTYTEKVWGIPCSELRAEWAAQRIKDLSLKTALLNMFLKPKNTIKTLIEEFEYPRRGPGMLWTAVKDEIEERGGQVHLNSEVIKVHRDRDRIQSVAVSCNGHQRTVQGTDFMASMPITDLIKRLDPPPPPSVLAAARNLKHRGFLTVCLVVDKKDLFDDNWIYVHDPSVRVGRIQNFKNWSPEMVPDLSKTSLGLEYFCSKGDELWNMADADLIELGKREVDQIGLADYADVQEGFVYRVAEAYPVYDADYRKHLDVVRAYVEGLENLQTIGRNGLHRYNNQDHTMLTGMLAVRNMMLGENNDVWAVNTDQAYHEESRDETGRAIEKTTEAIRETIAHVFPKLEPVAFGLSVGMAAGLTLFLATLYLVLKGGEVVGPNLGLLDQFFPGYAVTPLGCVLGLAYGFVTGFVFGWGLALVRNASLFFSVAIIQRRAEISSMGDILDYIY